MVLAAEAARFGGFASHQATSVEITAKTSTRTLIAHSIWPPSVQQGCG